MFCDESVMRQLERNRQKEYLSTLLMCAGQNSGIVPIMAFGESNVERRISHIMNIKKTRPYIVVALLLFAMVCFGGCVIKQNINEKDKEVGAVPENEITENGTTENDITENNTADSNDEVTQEKETTSDSSKPLSKYDMSVVNKVPYEQNNTGKWDMYGYIFEERAFVSGIIPGEDVRTTFVVLCKYGCGTFEKAAQEAKASRNKVGFSDTWQIVEHIKHDYKLENGRYISENSQEFIEIFDSTIEIRDLSKSYFGKEYSYFIENDFINIFNETVNDQIHIIDDVTLEYNGNRYIHINSSPKKEKVVSNRTGYSQYDELIGKMEHISETNHTIGGFKSIGVSYVYGFAQNLDGVGFYLKDLDNDGVEEMMIGCNSSGAGYGMFYDMYTIKDGKLTQVVCGGERDTYELCKNNIIRYEGSSSAATGWDAYYTYSDGKMNLIECVFLDGFYDGNPYGDDNLNDELFWCGSVIEDKYGTPITREQAMEINSKYEKVGFEFTCFSTVVYE